MTPDPYRIVADRRSRILNAAGVTDSELGIRAQDALDEIVALSDDVVDGVVDLIHTAIEEIDR